MSSQSTSSSSDSKGQTVTVEQLIGECFVKTAQIVLSSRIYEPATPSSPQRSAKRAAWFKLEVAEIESARGALDRWRGERGVGLPLLLNIYLHPCGAEDAPGTLLERWSIHYRPATPALLPLASGGLSRSQMARFNPQSVYKRLTLLIRSVYTYCRALPAHRLAKVARQARQRPPPFRLGYAVHSTLPPPGDTASSRMQRFEFSPVESADGQFTLSVEYQPASTVRVLGQAAVRLPMPAIIQDYVRTPHSHVHGHQSPRSGIAAAAVAANATGFSVAGSPPAATGLDPAPSAPAALATTPRRRSWSSSFRAAPARSYEPPPSYSPVHSPTPDLTLPRAMSTLPLARPPGPRGRPPLPPGSMPQQPPLTFVGSASPTAAMQPYASLPARGGMNHNYHSHHYQPLPQQQHREHAEDSGSDGEEADAEGNTAEDGAGRRMSAPVAIPGMGGAHLHGRSRQSRFRSSDNLGALGGAAQARAAGAKPLSAPATSHMLLERQSPESVPGAVRGGTSPPFEAISSPLRDISLTAAAASAAAATPPSKSEAAALATAVAAATMGGGLDPASPSFSATPSSYPASCSPDLPFAFTPTNTTRLMPASPLCAGGFFPSLGADSGGAALHRWGSSGGAAGNAASPSPPLAGREIPSGTALMRRASWGARSLSTTTDGSAPPLAIGYSVSPLQDVVLESLVSGASTPRQWHMSRGGSGMVGRQAQCTAAGSARSAAGSGGRRDPPLLLTFPGGPGGANAGSGGAPSSGALHQREESDGLDQLPFDFTAEDSGSQEGSIWGEAPLAAVQPGTPVIHPGDVSASGVAAQGLTLTSSAAAVGAFVKLVKDVQPLAGLGPVGMEDGLLQLAALRTRLEAHGIVQQAVAG